MIIITILQSHRYIYINGHKDSIPSIILNEFSLILIFQDVVIYLSAKQLTLTGEYVIFWGLIKLLKSSAR
jgi:hypothetical protein